MDSGQILYEADRPMRRLPAGSLFFVAAIYIKPFLAMLFIIINLSYLLLLVRYASVD